jgi:hypothetical protein
MHSQVSTSLKTQIQKLKHNYTISYLNKNKTKFEDIDNSLKIIETLVSKNTQESIVCSQTNKTLKIFIENSSTYKTLQTCGLCSTCKNYYHHTQISNIQHENWPVAYIGKGIICKKCEKKA